MSTTFKFIPYNNSHRTEWMKFYENNPHAWPGHHLANLEYERISGSTPLPHIAYDASDRIVALIPMFQITERRARFYPFRVLRSSTSLRAGPLLPADFTTRQRRDFFFSWSTWVQQFVNKHKFDEINISFPNVFGPELVEKIYSCFPLRENGFKDTSIVTLNLDLAEAEDEVMKLYAEKGRRAVRRALKAGAEAKKIETRSDWMNCYDLNLETFADEFVAPYSKNQMAVIWDEFVMNNLAKVFEVRYEGNLVSAGVSVGNKYSHYYWIGFSKKPPPIPGTNNLLIHQMIQNAKHEGARYFEVGGMMESTARQRGIDDFKRSFGGFQRYGLSGSLELSPFKQSVANLTEALATKLLRSGKVSP